MKRASSKKIEPKPQKRASSKKLEPKLNPLFGRVTFSISHFKEENQSAGIGTFDYNDSQKILDFVYECADAYDWTDNASSPFFKVLDMSQWIKTNMSEWGIVPEKYLLRQYVWVQCFINELNFVWVQFKNKENGELHINQHALYFPESVNEKYCVEANPQLVFCTKEIHHYDLFLTDAEKFMPVMIDANNKPLA